MFTWDQAMNDRRARLMALLQDKRCAGVRSQLQMALNAVTGWQRSGSRDDMNADACGAFHTTYQQACEAVDAGIEAIEGEYQPLPPFEGDMVQWFLDTLAIARSADAQARAAADAARALKERAA